MISQSESAFKPRYPSRTQDLTNSERTLLLQSEPAEQITGASEASQAAGTVVTLEEAALGKGQARWSVPLFCHRLFRQRDGIANAHFVVTCAESHMSISLRPAPLLQMR